VVSLEAQPAPQPESPCPRHVRSFQSPIGIQNVLTGSDVAIVWSNISHGVIYLNAGHGDKIFSDATQNVPFANAILCLGNPK
jgi:hypothetical protein